jgi:hypothetical protein
MKSCLLVLAIASGCGAPKDQTGVVVHITQPSILTLADMTMTAGSDATFRVTPDGAAWASTRRIGTVLAIGELRSPDDQMLGSLAADGTVHVGREQTLIVKEDGSIVQNGQTVLAFAADGSFTGPLGDRLRAAQVTMKGPPEGRRAVMFGWLVAASTEAALFGVSPWAD